MSALDTLPSTTSQPAPQSQQGTTSHAAGSRNHVAGGGGYAAQIQRLAPRENLPGIAIAGVTLTAQATGATFAAVEKGLGNAWTRTARAAAAKGAASVLQLFAPHLPPNALKLPLAQDIAAAYARWAATQPEIKADAGGASPKAQGEGKGGGPTQKHNLDVGSYGLMVPLEAAIGSQLGKLCPTSGRSVAAHVKGACSVEGLYLALALDMEASKGEDAFEVGGSATFSIGLGTTGENVAINQKLSVKGHGDDAVEAMHMAGLAIEHFMREQQFDWKHPSVDEVLSTGKKFLVNAAALGAGGAGIAAAGVLALAGAKIADALWGKNFERDIALQMDDDDYGEHSVGVGIGVNGEEEEVGMEVGLDYTHTTKVKNVGGTVGSESEDLLEGHFSVSFEAGGWELELGAYFGGTFGGATSAGFEIAMARKAQTLSGGDLVADMLGAKVRGLAHKLSKRATGFVGKIADGMDLVLRGHAAAKALGGAGGLKLTGEYDSASGVLTLALIVTKELASENNMKELEIDVKFEIGEQVASLDIPIDPPQ